MAHHRLDDGFSTTISFSISSVATLWEKEVTPVGYDAGGPIDTTTMRNTVYRTRAPKALKTLTQMSASCAYDPHAYTDLLSMVGIKQQITVHFPDGSSVQFWGWLDSFKPGRHVEGTQPMAEVVIEPSNTNASDVETNPTINAS